MSRVETVNLAIIGFFLVRQSERATQLGWKHARMGVGHSLAGKNFVWEVYSHEK